MKHKELLCTGGYVWAVFDLTSCILQLKDSFTEFHVTSASTTPTCVSGIGSEQLHVMRCVYIMNDFSPWNFFTKVVVVPDLPVLLGCF